MDNAKVASFSVREWVVSVIALIVLAASLLIVTAGGAGATEPKKEAILHCWDDRYTMGETIRPRSGECPSYMKPYILYGYDVEPTFPARPTPSSYLPL